MNLAILRPLGLAAVGCLLFVGCGPADSKSTATPPAAPLSDAPVMAAVAAGKANAAWRVPITGMSCDGCASGLQSELARTPGIAAAAVGFKEGLAVVAVDTNQVTFEKLAKVVVDAGYQASPPKP